MVRHSLFHKNLYFDNNGTTQPHPSVIKAVTKGMLLGNASSSYAIDAQSKIREFKQQLYEWCGADPATYEIIITSGASEANNLVIRGIVDAACRSEKYIKLGVKPNIILSAIEHKTSLLCAKQLEKDGRITVTLVNPFIDGSISPESISAAIKPETCLISVIHAHNELGNINDIQSISKIATTRGIFFHSDCVQSIGKFSLDMNKWDIGAISMTFHKLYAPVGIGALIIKRLYTQDNNLFVPQIGGTQNDNLRGGTDNLGAICGASEAMKITLNDRYEKNKKLLEMKNYIIKRLADEYHIGNFKDYYGKSEKYYPVLIDMKDPKLALDPKVLLQAKEVIFMGPVDQNGFPLPDKTTPNTLLFTVVKAGDGKTPYNNFCNIKLKRELQERNIIISIGSACNTNVNEPNYILTSMKAPFHVRCGISRISLGDYNTMSECKKLCDTLIELINKQ